MAEEYKLDYSLVGDIGQSLTDEQKDKISKFYKLIVKVGIIKKLKEEIATGDILGTRGDSMQNLMDIFSGKKIEPKSESEKAFSMFRSLSETFIINEWYNELSAELDEMQKDPKLNETASIIAITILGKTTAETLIIRAKTSKSKENTNEESN